jgi:hypothetical protein
MKNKIFLLLILSFVQNSIFAEKNEEKPLFEKNFFKINPLYFNYEVIKASNANQYSGNNLEFYTTNPSIAFHFYVNELILTPSLTLSSNNLYQSGSIGIAKNFDQFLDVGLYLLLNHNETSTGNGVDQSSIAKSDLLVGPYLSLYPFANDESYFEINARMAYKYSQYKLITNGIKQDVTTQFGGDLNLGFLYSIILTDKIYYSPSLNFNLYYTNDTGGPNTTRQSYAFEIIPFSIQVVI